MERNNPFVGLHSTLDNERLLWDISVRNQISKIKSFLSSIEEVHYRINNNTNEIDQIGIGSKRDQNVCWRKTTGENCRIETKKSHEMKEEDWKWLLDQIVNFNGVPFSPIEEEYYKRCRARDVVFIMFCSSIPKI